MKKFFLSIALFCCVSFAFSVGGNVFHGKSLSVIKTDYFDIIFCGETFEDAKKIASVADSYYLEITNKFEAEPNLRFPVSVTREVQSLNGFYSPFPYNMIVLYVAEPASPEMESYPDTLLSVFYHELTHAVTLNMKSPFFQEFSKIFGDFATPAALSMPYFWIEGAAVFSESGKNEENEAEKGGRLKNPYFTSLVVQAKINDAAGVKKFPSWRDVLGARDTTPGGRDRYVFGGCFAEYLVQNYGMEKYAELWKNAGKSTAFSFSAGIFKKTYGKKIDEVWLDFKKSIKIPKQFNLNLNEEKSNILSRKNSFVQDFDFFCDQESRKIAFYDSASRAVFLFDLKNGKKAKKLFSAYGITNLEFSGDGKKLFVTRYSSKKTVRIENGVFDIKKRKYKILQNHGKKECENLYVEKSGLNWKIVFGGEKFYPDSSDYEKIIFARPHFLKTDENTVFISFSWAKIGRNDDYQNLSLPKSGILKINLETKNAIFYFQKCETFAEHRIHALNDAALIEADENKVKILAALEDYESNPLYEIVFPPFSDENCWETIGCVSEKKESVKNSEIKIIKPADEEKFNIKKYSSFPYIFKGTFLPVGISPVKDSDFMISSVAFVGATYVTSKPFLDDFLVFSAGYEPLQKNAAAFLYLYNFDDSKKSVVNSSVVFDKEIFKQFSANLDFSKILWTGLVSSFSAGTSFDALYGRESGEDFYLIKKSENGIFQKKEGKFWKNGFFGKSKFYFSFSNEHQVAKSKNQILGVTFRPSLDFEYKNYNEEWNFDKNDELYKSDERFNEKYLNAGLFSSLRLPSVFPVYLSASVFPSSSYFFYGNAEMNLLSVEIQRGIPAISIYAARFDLNLSYSGKISYEHGEFWDILKICDIASDVKKEDFSDKISLAGLFTLNPNTGYAADSSCQFQIGASVFYRPNSRNGQSKTGFGISGNIGFL